MNRLTHCLRTTHEENVAHHDGKKLHEMNGHRDGVTAVAFHLYGLHLATTGRDTTVRIWREPGHRCGNCRAGWQSRSARQRSFPGQPAQAHGVLTEGRLSGDLRSDTGERADALGFVEAKDGKVTRFDLVIKGLGKNCGAHGFEGPLALLPKDTTAPVALGFELADPREELSRTLPHAARNPQYLK